MKRLEIIHLRSYGEPLESLIEQIKESIAVTDDSTASVTLFCREGLETDIAVHIHHLATSETEEPSTLGLHFASALKAFGLVEHTLWEELK